MVLVFIHSTKKLMITSTNTTNNTTGNATPCDRALTYLLHGAESFLRS